MEKHRETLLNLVFLLRPKKCYWACRRDLGEGHSKEKEEQV